MPMGSVNTKNEVKNTKYNSNAWKRVCVEHSKKEEKKNSKCHLAL